MAGSITDSIVAHVAADSLSRREAEVLRHAAGGLSNKLIGAHLDISEQTVKAHMKSVLSKLGARDRTHAVTLALTRGIIELEDATASRQFDRP